MVPNQNPSGQFLAGPSVLKPNTNTNHSLLREADMSKTQKDNGSELQTKDSELTQAESAPMVEIMGGIIASQRPSRKSMKPLSLRLTLYSASLNFMRKLLKP